jgi:NAD(P) transhydrogenase subunit alpha
VKIGIPKEILPDECRVAIVPKSVLRLKNNGIEFLVESGAGESALFTDTMYLEAGCKILPDAISLYRESEFIIKIHRPMFNPVFEANELDMINNGSILVAMLQHLINRELIEQLADKDITSFSMDAIPRIARAQMMDVLSSMSTLVGYKAVLLGANLSGRYLPLLMTAGATVPAAKVLIIGVGVAGLQAIATAHRLGAIVEAFDIRPGVREQAESLGAIFIEAEKITEKTEDQGGYAKEVTDETRKYEEEVLFEHIKSADIVITTALVPGKKAPILITELMVKSMKPGSVIVDLAAETGGNCELTEAGKNIIKNKVIISGPLNLTSSMPSDASQLYSANVSNLLSLLLKNGELNLDFNDAVINKCCITYQGKVRQV